MVTICAEDKSLISFIMDNSCGVLLQELQHILAEIGESKEEQDKVLLEIDTECLKVHQRMVEEAIFLKTRLYRLVAVKEAEISSISASLGWQFPYFQTGKKHSSLKEHLAAITHASEDLKVKKEERVKEFVDIMSQIQKINPEKTDNDGHISTVAYEEQDISLRKLDEYRAQLGVLQKEKSESLQKILEHTNELQSLCGILGLDFQTMVAGVHPNLPVPSSHTNISSKTGLLEIVVKLKEERKARTYKLQETLKSLVELWNLMGISAKDWHHFGKVAFLLDSPNEEIAQSGLLSLDFLKQVENEVERMMKSKTSRMKELVLKRRLELEEVCSRAHIVADMSTAPEKAAALMDSGIVDPMTLLAKIEAQIMSSREESKSRKEIIGKIDRWLAACEEEKWLEEYNQDENRYSPVKGTHLNLKRAEKARITVNRIPAIVDNLMLKAFAWEDKKSMPFLYDGVRLISILEDYRLNRLQKEKTKRLYKERKKLHGSLERESMNGLKPSPRRSSSFNSKATGGYHTNGNGYNLTAGCATSEFLSPRSYSDHHNSCFRDIGRISSGRLNFLNLPREDASSFASISGSDPESSLLG